MGSSSSKVAGKAAAGASRRQYPSTSSILNSAASTSRAPSEAPGVNPARQPSQPSQVRPNPFTAPPSDTKSSHIDLDARDPDFGAALRKLGPAVPVEQAKPGSGAFPTSSRPPLGQQGNNIFPSVDAAKNPALRVVHARERTGKLWEEESENLGRSSFAGRTLVSAKEIAEVLRLRDQNGMQPGEIEKQLRLKGGLVERLGGKGVVENT